MKFLGERILTLIEQIVPSTTLPSESVLHALITSFPAEYNSKQCGLFLSVDTSRTRIFSNGIIPRGSYNLQVV